MRLPLLDNRRTTMHKEGLINEIGAEQVSTSSTISSPTESMIVVTEDPLPLNINMQLVLTDDVLGDDSNSGPPPGLLYESGALKAGIRWRSC